MSKRSILFILLIVALGAVVLFFKTDNEPINATNISNDNPKENSAGMKEADIAVLGQEDVIDMIANQWMLITAGTNDSFNTMTASWGAIGNLWNKPVAFIFVRPDRYTHGFIENNSRVTLSVYAEEYREALNICGSKSGRDTDKVALAGLTPVELESGAITFDQARLTIDGTKIYQTEITEEGFKDFSIFKRWYGSGIAPHTMYIIAIDKVYTK